MHMFTCQGEKSCVFFFACIDHRVTDLVQELKDWLPSQQDKLYKTCKTDLSEKKDFDNEIWRWQTKLSHSTDEKPVTFTR